MRPTRRWWSRTCALLVADFCADAGTCWEVLSAGFIDNPGYDRGGVVDRFDAVADRRLAAQNRRPSRRERQPHGAGRSSTRRDLLRAWPESSVTIATTHDPLDAELSRPKGRLLPPAHPATARNHRHESSQAPTGTTAPARRPSATTVATSRSRVGHHSPGPTILRQSLTKGAGAKQLKQFLYLRAVEIRKGMPTRKEVVDACRVLKLTERDSCVAHRPIGEGSLLDRLAQQQDRARMPTISANPLQQVVDLRSLAFQNLQKRLPFEQEHPGDVVACITGARDMEDLLEVRELKSF
jgi:hypothetical protein